MRLINEIIVHCTDTPDTMEVTGAMVTAWHQKDHGWNYCGYHYVVRLDGTIDQTRPISLAGAHVRGHNAHSIGVAYAGGRHNGKIADTRTEAQKMALKKLLYNLVSMYRCNISGHHDYNSGKTCPNFDARKEYAWIFKKIVLSGV